LSRSFAKRGSLKGEASIAVANNRGAPLFELAHHRILITRLIDLQPISDGKS